MWGLRSSRTGVLAVAIGAFVLFCVLPLAYMFAVSVGNAGRTLSPYASLLLDSRQRALLYNTTLLGIGTALMATVVGVPLGVALARVALPFKTGLRIALAAPLLLPSYVVGLAWIYVGGSAGFVADAIGRQVSSDWIYSLPGAIFVLTLVLYPLSMLATEAAVRRIEPRLEEAALLVARSGRVFWRITLPLVAPSIKAAALVTFVLAVSDFGVPALLRVRVFTTEIFTAFAALYDFVRATLLTVPLLLLAMFVAIVAVRLAGERLGTTRRGLAGGERCTFDGWQGAAAGASACVVVVALVLPIAVLACEAGGVSSWASVIRDSRDAIRNSLTLAALGATAVLAVALWLGYARARVTPAVGLAADVLLVVLFAVPSTIVGIGLIGLWNRTGIAGALYGTNAMFVLVYLARFVPVAALMVAANLRRVPLSHEEAAAVSGAGWLRTMTHVVLPQIRLGLLAAWVIVFILAFGELGASVLVTPPGESTLPIRTYTLIANAPPSQVAALALLQAAVVFCPLAVLGLGLAVQRRS
jgi:iron(III) transport system permease protein